MKPRVATTAGVVLMLGSLASGEEAATLVAGARLRIRAGEANEIPGVVAIGPRTVTTKGVVVHKDTKLVAVKVPEWSEPLCLPRPKAILTGGLVAMDREALIIRIDGHKEPFRVPRQVVGTLDVSAGHKSRGALVAKGAGLGLLAGAAVGALLGASTSCSGCILNSSESAAVGGILLGGVGLVIGAAVGAYGSTDQWKPVPANQVQVSLRPMRRGVGLSVAVAF